MAWQPVHRRPLLLLLLMHWHLLHPPALHWAPLLLLLGCRRAGEEQWGIKGGTVGRWCAIGLQLLLLLPELL
jgi:hypothetical protein